jgi:hypothetical protein
VSSGPGPEGIDFYVSYEGTKTWSGPKVTGKVTGNKNVSWTLPSRAGCRHAGLLPPSISRTSATRREGGCTEALPALPALGVAGLQLSL